MIHTLAKKLPLKIPSAHLQPGEPLTKLEQEFFSLRKLEYNDDDSEAMLKLAHRYKMVMG